MRSFQILMKIKYSLQNFEKCSNINFYKDPDGQTDGQTDGRTDRRTDMTKLIVALRNFSDAPKTGF
jgi:hypothetical protein